MYAPPYVCTALCVNRRIPRTPPPVPPPLYPPPVPPPPYSPRTSPPYPPPYPPVPPRTPPVPPPRTSPPYPLPRTSPPVSPRNRSLPRFARQTARFARRGGQPPHLRLDYKTPAVATDRLLCARPCVCTAFRVYRLARGPFNNKTLAVATDRLLRDPHCRPGARDLSVVWGETRGGSPGLTRNLGVTWSSRGGQVTGWCTPPLAGHRGRATMAQGGLHRGVAVCGSTPGPPVTQPSPRLVPIPSIPHPLHLVFCTGTSRGGDFDLSNARPGGLDPGLGDGGVQGRRHRG